MSVVVKIEGVAIDANKIAEKSISIKRTFEKGRSLALALYYTASEGFPQEGQDIEVLEDTTLLFGGIIKTVKPVPITPDQSTSADIKLQITSDGYNDIPQRRTINTYYTDTDAGTIVNEMITSFLTDEGVTAGTISTGATLPTYNGIYQAIKDVLDDMADASGFSWNIDDDKELNFQSQATPVTTTKALESDDGDHFNFRPLRSLQRFRNKQYVEGGPDENGDTIRVVVEDSASIAARAAAENNSGVYGNVFRDNTIQTETDATAVATELLNRYVKPAKASFSSYGLDTVFDEGDVIEVDYPKYSIASGSEYLVTSKQLKREAHRWVYTYSIEARDSTDYSGRTKGNAVDFFSKLAKGSLYTGGTAGGAGGGQSGIVYDIIESGDLPVALGTTTVSRSFDHSLPDIVDILTTLTFQYTASAAVTLTLAYKDGVTTDYTFTMDLPAGENTKTLNIPEVAHPSGDHTFTIDMTASADAVLQLDQYLLTSRWEKYVNAVTPGPEITVEYKITIDHTKIDADLTDYPVPVEYYNIPDVTDYTTVHFVDESDIELSFERYRDGEFYVKIPLVSSTVDTVFYLKTDATSDLANSPDAWSSKHRSVTHFVLTDGDGDETESTGNGYDWDRSSTGITVDGLTGRALEFDGSYYLNSDPLGNMGFTTYPVNLLIVFKLDSLSSINRILYGSTSGAYNGLLISVNTSGGLSLSWGDGGGTATGNRRTYGTATGLISTGVWYCLHVLGNSFNDIDAYLNGQSVTVSYSSGGATSADLTGADYRVAYDINSSQSLDGIVDEVRMISDSISAAEAKADYHFLVAQDILTIAVA